MWKNKQKWDNILCLIFSLFSTWSVVNMLKIEERLYSISNSIFSILILAAIFLLFKVCCKNLNRRLLIIALISGFLFSSFMICGANLLLTGYTHLNKLKTLGTILAGVPFWGGIIVIVLEKLPELNSVVQVKKLDYFIQQRVNTKRAFFISWLLIFLAWIPGLIATYPGIYAYDSVFQMTYYTTGKILLHHPLIHTYLLGFCVSTLGNFLGSRELGMLIYSLFQMLCLSSAFAFIIAYMSKRKVTGIIKLSFLFLFMFFPVNALLSFSATKDVLYSALFALMVLMFTLVAEKQNLLYNNKFLILLIIISVLGMAFRNQGIYVFVFGMLWGMIVLRKHWKRLLIVFISVTLLFAVYSGPITILCGGVKSDNLREMMSVPCMQLSRAMLLAKEQLTEEEKQKIEDYVPEYEAYASYQGISDSMKRSFNSNKFKENPIDFLYLWISVGLKTPMSYVDAFARLTIGLWYPDMNYRDESAFHPYWEYKSTEQNQGTTKWIIVDRKTPEGMKWLSDFYYKLTYTNSYQKIPVVSMLFSSGAACWGMLIYIIWCIYERRYKYLFPASFVFGLWLTLLLGPVVLYRYVYPIIMTVPIFIGCAITETLTKIKKEEREY